MIPLDHFSKEPEGRVGIAKIADGDTTVYVRDASGNVMGVYKNDTLVEQSIYGSSRLGLMTSVSKTGCRILGGKKYELSNHLGNVLAVVADNINFDQDSTWSHVINTTDYYPFGLAMDGSTVQDSSYRYGFTGHEKDDEIKGAGRHLRFGDNWYDPRLGRRWNVDPMITEIPGSSQYSYALNNPNVYLDEDGKLPILPLLLKAGVGGTADMLAQAAMSYYFDPDVQSAGQAFEKVNWIQVGRSAVEGLIPFNTPGGLMGRAAATVTGDVLLNAVSAGSAYTQEQALEDFAVGFIGDLEGGGFGEVISKYGNDAVSKGFSRMGFHDKKIEEIFTGAGTTWKGSVDYSDIPDPRNAAAGKKFTTNQKTGIKNKNQAANNGYLRSDQDGTFLNPGQKGGSDPLQAEIDHVTPKSKGGSTSNSNAQVLSKKQNLTKANK